MKGTASRAGQLYWYLADAITVAIGWPGWLLPVITWLGLVTVFVGCGRIPTRQRS